MRDFRQLKVWEKSHQLALAIYGATQSFPRDEAYALTAQLRRAASSVPTNIAEGCGCDSDVEFRRFLQIAMRSATELEYHLILANDLRYIHTDQYQSLAAAATEVKKMLASFIVHLRGG
ncbi:MAG TPA: four helix bundle protein [Dehalococcoidia bacterium]|nr:four helix bundle protein [Dehalococcoidia bacterium]